MPSIVGIDGYIAGFTNRRGSIAAGRAIDDVLADYFPASGPPSWNPGVALLGPAVSLADNQVALGEPRTGDASDPDSGIIDVSRPVSAKRTFLQGLVSLAGAAGIALLAPFAILLVGLPVALPFEVCSKRSVGSSASRCSRAALSTPEPMQVRSFWA